MKKETIVANTMREFKEGKLRSSSGDKVTDRDQAIAIALSKSGQSKYAKGGYVVQYDPEKKKTITRTKKEADDFVEVLKKNGHTLIEVFKVGEESKSKSPASKTDGSDIDDALTGAKTLLKFASASDKKEIETFIKGLEILKKMSGESKTPKTEKMKTMSLSKDRDYVKEAKEYFIDAGFIDELDTDERFYVNELIKGISTPYRSKTEIEANQYFIENEMADQLTKDKQFYVVKLIENSKKKPLAPESKSAKEPNYDKVIPKTDYLSESWNKKSFEERKKYEKDILNDLGISEGDVLVIDINKNKYYGKLVELDKPDPYGEWPSAFYVSRFIGNKVPIAGYKLFTKNHGFNTRGKKLGEKENRLTEADLPKKMTFKFLADHPVLFQNANKSLKSFYSSYGDPQQIEDKLRVMIDRNLFDDNFYKYRKENRLGQLYLRLYLEHIEKPLIEDLDKLIQEKFDVSLRTYKSKKANDIVLIWKDKTPVKQFTLDWFKKADYIPEDLKKDYFDFYGIKTLDEKKSPEKDSLKEAKVYFEQEFDTTPKEDDLIKALINSDKSKFRTEKELEAEEYFSKTKFEDEFDKHIETLIEYSKKKPKAPESKSTSKDKMSYTKKEIIDFVDRLSYFKLDPNSDDQTIIYNTRKYGNVGSQTAGQKDLDAAERIKKEVESKFPGVKVEYGPSDEYVDLGIMLPNPKSDVTPPEKKQNLQSIKKQIIDFVEKNSWFESDVTDSDDSLLFVTRENGNILSESPGSTDIAEAKRLKQEIEKKFKGLVKIELEIVDEWVYINIDIKESNVLNESKKTESGKEINYKKVIADKLSISEEQAEKIIDSLEYSKEYYEKYKNTDPKKYNNSFRVYADNYIKYKGSTKINHEFNSAKEVFDYIQSLDFIDSFYVNAKRTNKVLVGLYGWDSLTLKLNKDSFPYDSNGETDYRADRTTTLSAYPFGMLNIIDFKDFTKKLEKIISDFISCYKIYVLNETKFESGGVIGQEIVFDDNGEENKGVIKDIHEITGDYIVATDDGRTVLASKELDVISLGNIRKKPMESVRKRFSFFKDGGLIDYKKKQLDIINRTNPAPNNINTWIRSVDDIKTAEEVFSVAFEEGAFYPDWEIDDMKEALNTGFVTIYSSYPIKPGVFVTPSAMNATDYAGGNRNKIHSKRVKLNEVAWIEQDEGQYAPVNKFDNGGSVPKTETILWAVKIGEPDWKEQIITTDPNMIEPAKKWAMENGFDRFRIVGIDMSSKPDFTKTFGNGGKTFSKYEIVEGYDHYKNIPLYRVTDRDEYVGEWHSNKSDAEKELSGLKSKFNDGGLPLSDRFYVKSNFGHWSVTDSINNKMIVGYSSKEDAYKTANGLNQIRDASQLEKTINLLQTQQGYGHFLNKYADGGNVRGMDWYQMWQPKQNKVVKVGDIVVHQHSKQPYKIIELLDDQYTVAKLDGNKEVEWKTFYEDFEDHKMFMPQQFGSGGTTLSQYIWNNHDLMIKGRYKVTGDVEAEVVVAGWEVGGSGKDEYLLMYQPSLEQNPEIMGLIVKRPNLRKMSNGIVVPATTGTGKKVKIQRIGGIYFRNDGQPY